MRDKPSNGKRCKIEILKSVERESYYTGEKMSWLPGNIEDAFVEHIGNPKGQKAEVDWG